MTDIEPQVETVETVAETVTVPTDPIQLPDDHPLVKTLAAQKDALKELREKAKRLDEIEEANKTEAQKQQEERETLLRENAELKASKLRSDVAATKGVPAHLLSGSTQAELEAAADALLEFRGTAEPKKLVVPGEGKAPSKVVSEEQTFVHDLFGGSN